MNKLLRADYCLIKLLEIPNEVCPVSNKKFYVIHESEQNLEKEIYSVFELVKVEPKKPENCNYICFDLLNENRPINLSKKWFEIDWSVEHHYQ